MVRDERFAGRPDHERCHFRGWRLRPHGKIRRHDHLRRPRHIGNFVGRKIPELDQALKNADLIVSKGQANFYLFSDYKKELSCPVMCLLTTKCPYVSSYFKKTELISVAKMLKCDKR